MAGGSFGFCCDDSPDGVWMCLCDQNFLVVLERGDPGETKTYTTDAFCAFCEDGTPSRVTATVTRYTGFEQDDYEVTLTATDCPLVNCDQGVHPFFGSFDGNVSNQPPTWQHLAFIDGFPVGISPEDYSSVDPLVINGTRPLLRDWVGSTYKLFTNDFGGGASGVQLRSGPMVPATSTGSITWKWTYTPHLEFAALGEVFEDLVYAGGVSLFATRSRTLPVIALRDADESILGVWQIQMETPYACELILDLETGDISFSQNGQGVYSGPTQANLPGCLPVGISFWTNGTIGNGYPFRVSVPQFDMTQITITSD